MRTLPYFPGCTLCTKALGFDRSVRASFRALGMELVELADWNCCGAVFPLSVDDMLALSGPARVLAQGRKAGSRLATACAACYNILKRTNRVMREDAERRDRVNFFIEADYSGDLKVVHLLELLRDDLGFDQLKAQVRRPLAGLRVASYYGCMLLRPPREVALDDPENPQVMEELFKALGAEAVHYPHRTECCGGYLATSSPESVQVCVRTILASAQKAGAEALAVSCPLCHFNLDSHQKELVQHEVHFAPLPVLYFTQLLALALGLGGEDFGWEAHAVDPRPLLAEKGLLAPKEEAGAR